MVPDDELVVRLLSGRGNRLFHEVDRPVALILERHGEVSGQLLVRRDAGEIDEVAVVSRAVGLDDLVHVHPYSTGERVAELGVHISPDDEGDALLVHVERGVRAVPRADVPFGVVGDTLGTPSLRDVPDDCLGAEGLVEPRRALELGPHSEQELDHLGAVLAVATVGVAPARVPHRALVDVVDPAQVFDEQVFELAGTVDVVLPQGALRLLDQGAVLVAGLLGDREQPSDARLLALRCGGLLAGGRLLFLGSHLMFK